MSLPVFHQINLRSAQLEELKQVLGKEMNLRHPVALNMKSLDIEQQRELIGVIENFFVSNNVSFKFPYPVYVVTDLEASITNMPTTKLTEELPKFFTQKDSKMNVKEMHLVSKNKLVQQEVKNHDPANAEVIISIYAGNHKELFDLETERKFYFSLYNRMIRSKNG